MAADDSTAQRTFWDSEPEKRCALCKKVKPLTEFRKVDVGVRGGKKTGRSKRWSYCNDCRKVKSKRDHARYYAIPEYRERAKKATIKSRWKRMLREMGVGKAEYEAMEAKQGGLCAICGRPETAKYKGTLRRLCIDHDHETGKIRALLCLDCNAGLGRFKDDPELLRKALVYLAAHGRG